MNIEKYKCELCNKSFDRKFNLDRHKSKNLCQQVITINEIDNNPISSEIECNICQKRFSRKFNLDRHLSSNRGDCYKIRNGKHKSITINNNNQYIIKQLFKIKQI